MAVVVPGLQDPVHGRLAGIPGVAADGHPLVHERGQRHPPAVAHVAHPVGLRHLGVGQVDLVELRLAGHLAQWPDFHAGLMEVDAEVGHAAVLGGIRVGSGDEQAPAGHVGVAGPYLLAVHHPFIAVLDGTTRKPRHVRSGARLGEQLAPDLLTGEKRP